MERVDVDLHRVVAPERRVPLSHLCHQRLGIVHHEGDVEVCFVVQDRDFGFEPGWLTAVRLQLDEVGYARRIPPFVFVDHPVDCRRGGGLDRGHGESAAGRCLRGGRLAERDERGEPRGAPGQARRGTGRSGAEQRRGAFAPILPDWP